MYYTHLSQVMGEGSTSSRNLGYTSGDQVMFITLLLFKNGNVFLVSRSSEVRPMSCILQH